MKYQTLFIVVCITLTGCASAPVYMRTNCHTVHLVEPNDPSTTADDRSAGHWKQCTVTHTVTGCRCDIVTSMNPFNLKLVINRLDDWQCPPNVAPPIFPVDHELQRLVPAITQGR